MNIVLKSTQMIQKLFSVIFKLIFLKYFIQDVKNNKSSKPRQKNHCNRRKPFWTKEKGWIFADELEVGDTFLSKSGEYHTLNSIYRETLAEPIFVYNIEVENAHTYFVSNSEILVYNKSEKVLHLGKYYWWNERKYIEKSWKI